MIQHVWSVLCERSIVDVDTNNITLSVLEQIKAVHKKVDTKAKLVALPFKGQIVSLWQKTNGSTSDVVHYRIRIRDLMGKYIGEGGGETGFGTSDRLRTRTSFDRLPVRPIGKGYYYFVVELKANDKWKRVAQLPLLVEVEIQQDTEANAGN